MSFLGVSNEKLWLTALERTEKRILLCYTQYKKNIEICLPVPRVILNCSSQTPRTRVMIGLKTDTMQAT